MEGSLDDGKVLDLCSSSIATQLKMQLRETDVGNLFKPPKSGGGCAVWPSLL